MIRRASFAAAAVSGLALALAVAPGIPLLRHDWSLSPFILSPLNVLTLSFTGWASDGFGAARPYPDAYLISLPLAFARFVFGPTGSLTATLLAVGWLSAFGALALARDADCDEFAAIAAVLFSVFNPWVFVELVAGHVYMLLAYSASFWLIRELIRAEPRTLNVTTFALLTLQQIQFFLVSTLLTLAVAVHRRKIEPLFFITAAWAPICLGLLLDRSTLGSIPLILAWERGQSVRPLDAIQLSGYFASYGDIFRGIFSIGTIVTAVFAASALRLRDKRVYGIAGFVLVMLILAMGITGPLGTVFQWSIENFRPIGLFREFFDALGYVAIGYVALACLGCRGKRCASIIWVVAAVLLPSAWLASPPSRFWVSSLALPSIVVHQEENTRFALIPAFQPMSYDGRGSGADPDAYARAQNVTPINEYLATYPVNAALAQLTFHKDTSSLQALSVATIFERPSFRSDGASLSHQWPLPASGINVVRRFQTIQTRPAPELALQPLPEVTTLDSVAGSGNILFGDASLASGVLVPASWNRFRLPQIIRPSNGEIDASRDWVDANLAFSEQPELAQPYGGAVTMNAKALLPLRGGLPALVFVRGRLVSEDGVTLVTASGGYRWIRLRDEVRGVRCEGLCIVAARGAAPDLPLNAPRKRQWPLTFKLVFPWLAIAEVPSGKIRVLHYNVAYDEAWQAYLVGTRLTHIRIDGISNGWLVPARTRADRVVIVESTAALQFAAQVIVILILAATSLIVACRQVRQRWLRLA